MLIFQKVTKPDCEPKGSQLSTSSRKSSEKQGEIPGRNHNACISVNCSAVPIGDIPDFGLSWRYKTRGRSAPFRISCMVGEENKRKNSRTMQLQVIKVQ